LTVTITFLSGGWQHTWMDGLPARGHPSQY